jgi:hypothetical protein
VPGIVSREEPDKLLDARRRARVFLESLPSEDYPRLVEAAAPLSETDDPAAHYALGLDLPLAGIEAMAARKEWGLNRREIRTAGRPNPLRSARSRDVFRVEEVSYSLGLFVQRGTAPARRPP